MKNSALRLVRYKGMDISLVEIDTINAVMNDRSNRGRLWLLQVMNWLSVLARKLLWGAFAGGAVLVIFLLLSPPGAGMSTLWQWIIGAGMLLGVLLAPAKGLRNVARADKLLRLRQAARRTEKETCDAEVDGVRVFDLYYNEWG